MKLTNEQFFIALGIGAALLYYLEIEARKNADLINPTSQNNLAYQAVDKTGQALTGNANWDLGTAIYNLTHEGSPAETAGTTGQQINTLGP